MAYAHRLTDEEKQELLRIARATLREFLRTGRVPPGKPHRDSLVAEAGAFVSLHIGPSLRGCIGTQQESKPLYKTIQEMVVAAASRDPRFNPVTGEEFDSLIIEISVLGDRGEVRGPEDIVIGEHGITIDRQGRRGLLLPQVASDNNWDAETFLEHVCAKAGMPHGSWREEGCELERFTAQVFSETTHPRP